MAKESMIQREKKRERLIAKYTKKRDAIKNDLKDVSSFTERVALYKKFESIPRNSSPLHSVSNLAFCYIHCT